MVDYFKNAPRLRNRLVMPRHYAIQFAKFDYAFYEACMRTEATGHRVATGTPAKLLEQDRILSLQEIRMQAENVLLANNVPASQWADAPVRYLGERRDADNECQGR